MTKNNGLLVRGSAALVALTAVFAPLSLHAAAMNYSGGIDIDNIDPAGTGFPPGWFGIQYTGGTASAVTSLTTTTAPDVTGSTATVGGLYNVTFQDTHNGLGSLTDATNTFALVKEYVNVVPGSHYTSLGLSFIAEEFRLPNPSTPSSVQDSLVLQYLISSTPLNPLNPADLLLLSQDVDTPAGILWSPVFSTSTFQGDSSIGNGNFRNDGVPVLSSTWDTGEYLYLRWYDTRAGDAPGTTTILGQALTLQTLFATPIPEGVPEPSTWIAAGLLLGCVAFRSLKRKSVDAAVAA